jgi:hypothetical protein
MKQEEADRNMQRKEVLELCIKHLEEIKYLETREFHQRVENERRNLFEGGDEEEAPSTKAGTTNKKGGGGEGWGRKSKFEDEDEESEAPTPLSESQSSRGPGRKMTALFENNVIESALPDIDIAEDLENIQRKNYELVTGTPQHSSVMCKSLMVMLVG